MTRIVAMLAHPDDAEILAGGTLYKHQQRGDSVQICSLRPYLEKILPRQRGVANPATTSFTPARTEDDGLLPAKQRFFWQAVYSPNCYRVLHDGVFLR